MNSYAFNEDLMMSGIRKYQAEQRKLREAELAEAGAAQARQLAELQAREQERRQQVAARKPPQPARIAGRSVVQRYDHDFFRRALQVVADLNGVAPQDVLGPRHFLPLVAARHTLAKLLRDELHLSLQVIGRMLGNRHHTTVLSSLRNEQRLIDESPGYRDLYAVIRARARGAEIARAA